MNPHPVFTTSTILGLSSLEKFPWWHTFDAPTEDQISDFYNQTYSYQGDDWGDRLDEGADNDECPRFTMTLMMSQVLVLVKPPYKFYQMWIDVNQKIINPLYKNKGVNGQIDSKDLLLKYEEHFMTYGIKKITITNIINWVYINKDKHPTLEPLLFNHVAVWFADKKYHDEYKPPSPKRIKEIVKKEEVESEPDSESESDDEEVIEKPILSLKPVMKRELDLEVASKKVTIIDKSKKINKVVKKTKNDEEESEDESPKKPIAKKQMKKEESDDESPRKVITKPITKKQLKKEESEDESPKKVITKPIAKKPMKSMKPMKKDESEDESPKKVITKSIAKKPMKKDESEDDSEDESPKKVITKPISKKPATKNIISTQSKKIVMKNKIIKHAKNSDEDSDIEYEI